MTPKQTNAIQTLFRVDEDDVLEAISGYFEPEEVFSKEVLDEWAKSNHYVKE